MSQPRLRVRAPVLAVVGLLCVGVVVTACGIDQGRGRPDCRDRDVETLVVMAQSVQSAALIPCLQTLPVGWNFEGVMSQQDQTQLFLNNDRGGMHALVVTLKKHSALKGAEQVPSDEPGTRRYERIRALAPSYSSVRYYVFPGGCVVYDFKFGSQRVSGLINEASLMLGFVTRDSLHDAVKRETDGRTDDAP